MVGSKEAVTGRTSPSDFRSNLQHVVECIRADGALVLLHTPPYVDLTRLTAHIDPQTYVRVLFDMSRALALPCVDHWTLWEKAASGRKNIDRWLSSDGLHPTAEGHRVLAKRLCNLLEREPVPVVGSDRVDFSS
jgi:acyl-CoA thioesterase-1